MPSAVLMFCSTSTIAVPKRRLICTAVSSTRCTSTGARPIDGSSIIMSRGRCMSAVPTATICCWPPDIVPTCWARRSARIGKSSRISFIREAMPARSHWV